MNKSICILAILFLVACEDGELCDVQPYEYDVLPLHIDTHCHEEHVEAIKHAVDELNRVSASEICQPVIAIGEPVNVDHGAWKVPMNTITCYYDEPEWVEDHPEIETKVGWGTLYKYARIFIWKVQFHHVNYIEAIAIHELGHYIGMGHVDDKDAVMRSSINAEHRSFTSADVDEFNDTR